jgi:hypothetical protein
MNHIHVRYHFRIKYNIAPGDYNVPGLVGNNDIVYSHIKTPPGFTFSKTGLGLSDRGGSKT